MPLQTGRSQAFPLSAWLRVPLSWYRSTTYAFFDDETHASIRRCYTSPIENNSKRHFCGFCGTPLSFWSEEPETEADYISLTLGSLATSDLRDLEELGLLPKEALEDVEDDKERMETTASFAGNSLVSEDAREGLPWFETMVEGSKLGKMSRTRGQSRTGDGRLKVEWEIVEWDDGSEGETLVTGKRKLDDMTPDSKMEGLQH